MKATNYSFFSAFLVVFTHNVFDLQRIWQLHRDCLLGGGGGGGETKKLVLDQFIKSVEFSLPYMCVISWGRFVECISVVTGLRAPSKLLATCGENHAK